MKKAALFLLVLGLLFAAGCSSNCDKPKVVINGDCCFDGNKNNICDIDEAVNQPAGPTINQTINHTVNHTANISSNRTVNLTPIKQDCSNTKLSSSRMKYFDGGNASVRAIFSNTGYVNITGISFQVYNDNGKKIDKSLDVNLSKSQAREIEFIFGNYNIVDENKTITMIMYAPKIKGQTCGFVSVYNPDIVVIDD